MSKWIAIKDRQPVVGQRIIALRNGSNPCDWIENYIHASPSRMTHWHPAPELPPNPDPFEEWLADNYTSSPLRTDVIALIKESFNAGLEAGRKEHT